MEKKVSVCIIKTDLENKYIENILKSLEENEEFINEIIFTGSDNEIPDSDLAIKSLNLNSDNKAFLRNKSIENVNNDLILFVSNAMEIEDSTIEEFLEVLEESNADIIYSNEVIKTFENEEIIRNFSDWFGKEKLLLQSLAIENHLPEFGILVKKEIFEKFGHFDEDFNDFEFYNFIYQNIDKIKLKLSDISFITTIETDRFIDTSFNSKALRDMIKSHDWKTNIFPSLNWQNNENLALSTAFSLIGKQLEKYQDFFNASEFYRKAMLTYHNQYILLNLINTYYNMGLFEEALSLTHEDQGLDEKTIQAISERIKQAKSLVENIERAIEEGHAGEILSSAGEIIQIYQGAPIYNIFGIIYNLKNEIDNAYKFLYKAVIMNPLEEDILRNLVDVSKRIGKEENIKKLINRIVDTEKTSVSWK